MKKRLKKKYEASYKLIDKRLTGRYAQTISRRLYTYAGRKFLFLFKPKCNYARKYIIIPCMDRTFDSNGEIIAKENELFFLSIIGK